MKIRVLLPKKAFIGWRLWVPAWFKDWCIITIKLQDLSSISQYHKALLLCCHFVGIPYPYWCLQGLTLDLFSYIFLSDGKSPRSVRYAKVESIITKLRHLSLIGSIFVIQPLMTHFSRRSSYFYNSRWCAQSIFSSKGTNIRYKYWQELFGPHTAKLTREFIMYIYIYVCVCVCVWIIYV